jgi:hypothetical protein
MTTVVYDGRVLAADSQVSSGDRVFGKARKLFELSGGRLLGCVGSAALWPAVVAWLEGGPEPQKRPEEKFSGILVHPGGRAEEISEEFRLWPACVPWAGGTGESAAMAAFYCGRDAVRAVECAIALDVWSGGPIQSLNVKRPQE